MKEFYNNFSQNSFNVNVINRIINETQNITSINDVDDMKVVAFQDTQSISLLSSNENWKYIYIFLHIFKKYQVISGWLKVPNEFEWLTISVGTFFIQNLGIYVRKCEGSKKKSIERTT